MRHSVALSFWYTASHSPRVQPPNKRPDYLTQMRSERVKRPDGAVRVPRVSSEEQIRSLAERAKKLETKACLLRVAQHARMRS